MFEPTLDRDVRFSEEQITFTLFAVRGEITKRTRSIAKAEAARAAGATIQHNVLDEHYRALTACNQVREKLEVAKRQIGHQIAARAAGFDPYRADRTDTVN